MSLEIFLQEKAYIKPGLRYFELRIRMLGDEKVTNRKSRDFIMDESMARFYYRETNEGQLVLESQKKDQKEG